MLLLITYDLHQPDRDYQAVCAEIQSTDSCVRVEESVWIVDTGVAPRVWRDRLSQVTDDATFFVVPITRPWSGYRLDPDAVEWLSSDERRW